MMRGRRLSRTGRHNWYYTPIAMSLHEVLIVMGIIALFIALLVPSLSGARELSRRLQCSNNLRQFGIAERCYRDDYDDYLPTEGTYVGSDKPNQGINKPDTWYNQLPPYLGAPAYKDVQRTGKLIVEFPRMHVWICPSKTLTPAYKSPSGKNQFHYGMNQVLDGLGKEPDGSKDTPGFFDGYYYLESTEFQPTSCPSFSQFAWPAVSARYPGRSIGRSGV